MISLHGIILTPIDLSISKNIWRLLVLLAGIFLLSSCSSDEDVVNVDEVFWSAYRNPETFDSYLVGNQLDGRTANCFEQYRDKALNLEQLKLQECALMLTGSLLWNDCHEEAEEFHNNAVLMNDIARTIEGTTSFDATQSYALLVITKSLFTTDGWNTLINDLIAVAAPMQCRY